MSMIEASLPPNLGGDGQERLFPKKLLVTSALLLVARSYQEATSSDALVTSNDASVTSSKKVVADCCWCS